MFQFLKHSLRVSNITAVFAENLNLAPNDLITAALLHDIGKIYVPASILNKPSKLNEEEMTIMKGHIYHGSFHLQCRRSLPFGISYNAINDDVIRVIEEHHENYDGTGYIGKKKEDIHIGARLLRIADCYDALVSKRAYKNPLPHDEAIKIMLNEAHIFDPVILDRFVNDISKRAQICANLTEDTSIIVNIN